MLRYIKQAWKDVSEGENLELHTIVFISVIIAVLGLLGIASFEVISATILGTLSLIASSLLSSRKTMNKVQSCTDQLNREIDNLRKKLEFKDPSGLCFKKEYPDLGQEYCSAKQIGILGASLHSTTLRYYGNLEEALKNGARLRTMVCEPSPDVVSMQTRRVRFLKDPNSLAQTVENHLELLKQLKSNAPNPDLCISKTLPFVISYGMIFIEDNLNSYIYVKLMPFKVPSGQYPVFKVDKLENPEWFKFFNDQFEKMWEAGTEI